MGKLVDGGARTVYSTGAVREICEEEKGRCDLVYNTVFGSIYDDGIFEWVEDFVREGDPEHIRKAISYFMCSCYPDPYTPYLELAKHYAEGAKKYSDRNMERGIPWHSMVDSALRHYVKYLRGDTDEPHDRAFLWNMVTLLYMVDNHPELNDLPCGKKEN